MAIAIFVSGVASAGENYILPTEANVLTESQLAGQLLGSTRSNARYSEYCEKPIDGQLEVELRGIHKLYGKYGGKCIVKGHLFCWEIDRPPMSEFNACRMLALDGDTLTEYTLWPRAKLTNGNPESL
ncbi:MAG: hypothetical protein AAF434_10660 [Pseudomonadota bacterium]